MSYYDIDKDGNISYEEFLRGLRDELSERKKLMVEKAFNILDKDGSGEITVKDVINIYDVSQNKEFQEGKKSREEVIAEFLDSFDGAKGNNDGIITKEEFLDYYSDLAISCPTEEYFVRMMEQTWGISEDEESPVFKDKVKHIIQMMRHRLLDLSNSHLEEFQLRQIFRDFDTNQSGTITIDELAAMCAKLGICVERKYLMALLKVLDTNKSGMLEFEEFQNFLIYDPYK